MAIFNPPNRGTGTSGTSLTGSYVTIDTDQIITGDKTFDGDVTFNGTVLNNLVIEDNTIVINSGETAAGVTAGEAGLQVDRGTSTDAKILFTEGSLGVDNDNRWIVDIGDGVQEQIIYDNIPDDINFNGKLTVNNDLDVNFNLNVDGTSVFNDVVTMSGAAIQLDTAYTPAHSEGLIFYDQDDKCLTYYNEQNDMAVQVGQEAILRIVNKTGSQIDNGTVVYINGAQGNRPTVGIADKDNEEAADATIGLATHDIPNNQNGYITTFGLVRGVNTFGFGAGDTLWLGNNGGYTNVRPVFPAHIVEIGHVVTVDTSNGAILVDVKNGTHLEYLHDVNITGMSDGDLLTYSASLSGWKNTSVVAAISGEVINQNKLSYFEPFVIESTPELVSISGSEYYTEIQQSYGNLIAIDADVGTYEEIEVRISSEWTNSQVGTFRLDLDVKSGQTFTFDNSIGGIADVTLPDVSGAASLLFDKPYGTTTWYVRQNI